ncbi:MAG: metalloregulator ArsR/SmtB family transcription factor [Anaerolineales bacterium]|nr:metalloregulator ArsR/SmtB family transcription factor [Anaerolineales bacterium]
MSAELVAFFKALADSNRLKIVGLLAQQTYSVEQLAALLNLRPSTVSHHLARLSEVGLVSARADSYYNVYQLEEAALRKTNLLFSQEDLASMINDVDLDAYDRQVVGNFTNPDGTLKSLPAQRKKLEAVLHYVITAFKPGKHYNEEQVNKILVRYYDDTASLRRELVGFKLLQRDSRGGEYWRAAEVDNLGDIE